MTQNTDKSARFLALATELVNRRIEALQLLRLLPTQEAAARATAKEVSQRGGNRAGKSLLAAALTASVALQQPLTTYSGEIIPPRYLVPLNADGKPSRPRQIWIVGYDGNHIGKTIHRLLFKAGAFKIIRDKQTNAWRAYQPWNPEDAAREGEVKPAPPLIPPRFIDPKGWSWEDKANREFKLCRLLDGTEIRAMSSKAEEWQGDSVDWIWVDEDIYRSHHYQEWLLRTAEPRGKIIWSYYPKTRNTAARELSKAAAQQKGRENPTVQEFILTFSANPFIPTDEKSTILSRLTDQERRARDLGEFVTDGVLMYPNFSDFIHATPRLNREDDSEIDRILRERGGEPPEDWTRYLVLDPGHTRAAVLYAAVPPPALGDFVVLYDELYLERHDADALARKVKLKNGTFEFEAFIIDDHAGRITPMGYAQGQTVKQHYVQAFRRHEVSSLSTGYTFIPGADNIAAGIEACRTWLTIRSDGTCKFKYVASRMPNFREEIETYSKNMDSRKNIDDDPAPRQADHLMDTWRYLAAYNPRYKRPIRRAISSGVNELKNWWANLLGPKKQDSSIYAGPGSVRTLERV